MNFMEISSLGADFRYVFKTEHKFKQQNKWVFRFRNLQQQKHGKGGPNSQNKVKSKEGQPQEIHSKP
jgi:hypothetical protein